MKTTVPFFCFPPTFLFLSLLLLFNAIALGQTNAWINEIHYDNNGTDQNEGVEITIENPGNLSDYRIDLYNGSNGTTYNNQTVDAITPGAVVGNFHLFHWNIAGIQNGEPDGIALSYQGIVIQFLSYEGSFTATDGPANTLVSIDIGVSESNSTTPTQSMQLQGTGTQYSAFTWVSGIENTYGIINTGQDLQISGNLPPSISNISQSPEAGNVTSSDAVVITAQISDSDGVGAVTLNYGNTSGNLDVPVTMTNTTGDSYSATIPAQADGTTVFYQVVAADLAVPPAVATSLEGMYTVQDPLGPPSVIINEMSQGSSGNKEWIELLVVEDNLNIQGWDVGDNDGGSFNTFFTFSNDSQWASVAAGTLITIYNSVDADDVIIDDLDITDLAVVIPSNNSQYFDPPGWGAFGNSNSDDTAAIRDANDVLIHDMAGGHPSPIISAPGTGETKYYIGEDNAIANLQDPNNWVEADAAKGTPSRPNGGFNTVYINSLRGIATYYYNSGSWTPMNPSGNSTTADAVLVMDGTVSLTGNTEARKLIIDEGAEVSVSVILSVVEGIDNNGSLTFTSTATSNGELAALPNGATIQGEITVERYMSANRAYRLLSSPVTTSGSIRANWQEGVNNSSTATNLNPNPGFGTHITGSATGANGFDASGSGNVSMFTVDVPAQSFVPIANTDVNTLVGGVPYLLFVRGDRSIDLTDNDATPTETVLRATGTLSTGTVQQTYTVSAAGDFIAFGNPYQSSVDMSAVLSGNTDVNPNFYYVYDPTLGDNGSYTTIDLTTNMGSNGSAANQYLQPGQVGQVEAITAGSVSILFEQTDKAPGNHTPTFQSVPMPNQGEYLLSASLYTTDTVQQTQVLHDSFLLRFSEAYTNERTLTDAKKPWNFDENFGSNLEGVPFSIQRRALPEATEEVPLSVYNYRHSEYYIQIEYTPIPNRTALWVDQYTNTTTRLEDGQTSIPFSVDVNDVNSAANDRFYIAFEEDVLNVQDHSKVAVRMFPNPVKGNTVSFALPEAMQGQALQVYLTDVRGRKVFQSSETPTGNTLQVMLPSLESGVYMVQLVGMQERATLRLIKE
jgi:hypothetical protein